MQFGELFVVATPIGNLEDISFRAVKTLREVDVILCEDTRVSRKLLRNYDINAELISFNAHSEIKKINNIIKMISKGEKIALISDAGTPAISDPGVRLVSSALKNSIKVTGIPGASAVTMALSISGLPTDEFTFIGFLPQKKGRQKKLKEISEYPKTVVLYESMYRVEKLIKELVDYMPKRYITVCRELTKLFEETWRGYPTELLNNLSQKTIKGEFVIIIAPIKFLVE